MFIENESHERIFNPGVEQLNNSRFVKISDLSEVILSFFEFFSRPYLNNKQGALNFALMHLVRVTNYSHPGRAARLVLSA